MKIAKTITSVFMVPTLKVDKDVLIANNFVNGYVQDVRRDIQYQNAVYLLFKPENLDKFREFLDSEYERTKDVIDDYDYEDGYVVVVYTLNKKWKKDFGLIREGLYSRTSKEFQNVFPKIVKVKKGNLHRDEISLQFRIFNKTEDLRTYWENRLDVEFTEEMELWRMFDLDEEKLDLDKIKEKQLV
jgi:hypothetical protein